jgi:hypothetical protein
MIGCAAGGELLAVRGFEAEPVVMAEVLARLSWVAEDERGRELEIVAIEKPDCYLVIHVMPTHYRKEGR